MHAETDPVLNGPIHDVLLDRVIEGFERAFPGRVRGYYMHGSLADGSGIATSDLDIDIVVKGTFTDENEQTRLVQIARGIAGHSRYELDIEVLDERSLLAGAEPSFKLGGRLVYGDDIRAQVPLIPLDDWARERMYRGYFLLVWVFRRPAPVRYPLGFPDPDAEFYGYTSRGVTLPKRTSAVSCGLSASAFSPSRTTF